MKRIFFIVCMIMASMSFAKKWDATYISKLIAGGGIDKVIEYYKGRYYGENRDPQDAFKIAELYVKKKDYATAMDWYDKESQLINTSKVNLFNYANTNRLMGEYQKALDGYLMYAALTGDVNKVMDLANQCEKILRSSALSYNYKLENYTYNTSADETNVAFLRNNAVYVTIENADKENEKPAYSIYQVVREFENFAEPVKAYNNNIPKLVITSLSYSEDGNTVVFSAKDEKAITKKGKTKNEKIYIADNLGGTFLNAKPVPFNIEGYSLKNPSFNADGTAIYFSSNQTGGLGGFDIWKSTLVNNKWTTPKNLGKLLNSTADDVNPFLVQDGKNDMLYFSSDREGGFGGFDIYKAKETNNTWQDVDMQPAPINSAGDDISIVYDDKIKTGYFSSNRTDGKGGFDLYRFTPFNLKLLVYTNDTFSDKFIDYALVQVFDGSEKLFEGVTDETGKAIFQINKNKSYILKISKDNYRPIIQRINSTGTTNGDSVIATILLKPDAQFSISKGATNNLSLDNYIIFTGKLTDAATNKPATKTKMRMVNYTTQKLREVDVDANGRYEIKLLLNNNYKIIFENQENKVTDELTTYGMERNSVKVYDYLLSGNKFKLTENKVYKVGNVPPDIYTGMENKPNSTIPSGASIENKPITQTKIDSLKDVLARDMPQPPFKKTVLTTNNEVQKPTSTEPIIVVTENTELRKHTVQPNQTLYSISKQYNVKLEDLKKWNNLSGNDIKVGSVLNVSLPGNVSKVPDAPKTASSPVSKPVSDELVAKLPVGETTKEQVSVSTEPVTIKKEQEPQLAADIVTTKKSKKVKVIQTEETDESENTIPEKTAEPSTQNITPADIKEEIKTTPKLAEPIVVQEPVIKKEEMVKTVEIPKVIEKSIAIETPVVQTTKPEEKTDVQKPETVVQPDIYYKIQLASYDVGNIKFPEFEYLGKIEEVKAYERYIYRLGNFEALERAKEVLDLVRTKGYFVAFILQYNKDKVTGIVK